MTYEKQIVFGIGSHGRRYISEVDDVEIVAIADNNKKLWGNMAFGHPIIPPSRISEYNYDKIVIAIDDSTLKGCEYVSSIISQLCNMGIPNSVITLASLHSVNNPIVDFLRRLSNELKHINAKGAAAECGVWRGYFAMYINSFFPDRTLYLFDTFEGFNQKDVDAETYDVSKDMINRWNERCKTTTPFIVNMRMKHPEKVIVRQGWVPETFAGLEDERFCFVNLDMDLYKPMLDALRWFAPRMLMGGVILCHDYYNDLFPGVKQAVDEFAKEMPFTRLPIGDKCSIALVFNEGAKS